MSPTDAVDGSHHRHLGAKVQCRMTGRECLLLAKRRLIRRFPTTTALTPKLDIRVQIAHPAQCISNRDTYLKTPPDALTLAGLLNGLGLEPRELMRKTEATYTELGLDDRSLDRTALIAAMVETPVLIERPIVVAGRRVALGRPPEAVLEIL